MDIKTARRKPVRGLMTKGLLIVLLAGVARAETDAPVYPGADERTPSYSHYFSWINNTNEGSTEQQTLTNPHFPALRSGPTPAPGASRKRKFLAATIRTTTINETFNLRICFPLLI